MLYPYFQKINAPLRKVCKFLYFNVVIIAVEALVMFVLAPEATGAWMLIIFLLLFNVTFVCFDFIVPRFEIILSRYLQKLKNH